MPLRSLMPLMVAMALGLAALACSPHPADRAQSCPGIERNPALLTRIMGRWAVRYADHEVGQKPPTKVPLGELEFAGCRYRFLADPEVKQVGSPAWREWAIARRELPFLDASTGQVEVLDGGRGLGAIRLHPDGGEGGEAASWTASVVERSQEGEHLYLAGEGHRWSVSRGTWRWRDDEAIPGADLLEP